MTSSTSSSTSSTPATTHGSSAASPAESDPPIFFFDGVCGLCDTLVLWLLRHDRRRVLLMAPLQGETAARLLGARESDPLGWSLVLVAGGRVYERSDAALETLGYMGLPWSSLRFLRIVPRLLRDAVYRFIARRRYRWFGKREACRIPTADQAARFLP